MAAAEPLARRMTAAAELLVGALAAPEPLEPD